ncbi:MAG: hypothetical protein AAF664_20525, partial [Planctomycetota bacterium]
KTLDGNESELKKTLLVIPSMRDLGGLALATVNDQRSVGEEVYESQYVILHDSLKLEAKNETTFPSELVKLNVWEGTCGMELGEKKISIATGTGDWWGCALEIQGEGKGENLSKFLPGTLHFEIRGDTQSSFQMGYQSGTFNAGSQVDHFVVFGADNKNKLSSEWAKYSIPIKDLSQTTPESLGDVTSLLFFKGANNFDGKSIEVRRIYWSME